MLRCCLLRSRTERAHTKSYYAIRQLQPITTAASLAPRLGLSRRRAGSTARAVPTARRDFGLAEAKAVPIGTDHHHLHA